MQRMKRKGRRRIQFQVGPMWTSHFTGQGLVRRRAEDDLVLSGEAIHAPILLDATGGSQMIFATHVPYTGGIREKKAFFQFWPLPFRPSRQGHLPMASHKWHGCYLRFVIGFRPCGALAARLGGIQSGKETTCVRTRSSIPRLTRRGGGGGGWGYSAAEPLQRRRGWTRVGCMPWLTTPGTLVATKGCPALLLVGVRDAIWGRLCGSSARKKLGRASPIKSGARKLKNQLALPLHSGFGRKGRVAGVKKTNGQQHLCHWSTVNIMGTSRGKKMEQPAF